MKSDKLKKVEEYGNRLLKVFPCAKEQSPVALCKKLRRLETKAHRLTVDYCNAEITSSSYDKASEECLAAVNRLLGNEGNFRIPVFINSDARGYAIKVLGPDLEDNRKYWKIASENPEIVESVRALRMDWGNDYILGPEL